MKLHVPALQMIAGGAVPSLRELLSSSNEAFQARQSKIVVPASLRSLIYGRRCLQLSLAIFVCCLAPCAGALDCAENCFQRSGHESPENQDKLAEAMVLSLVQQGTGSPFGDLTGVCFVLRLMLDFVRLQCEAGIFGKLVELLSSGAGVPGCLQVSDS